jgi:hypothetical protein
MLVKHFSKTGHAKMGDRVEGWNKRFLQWFLRAGFDLFLVNFDCRWILQERRGSQLSLA